MPTPNADIMKSARASLKGKTGTAIAVFVVFAVILGSLGTIPVVGWLAGLFLTGPMIIGFSIVFLNITREKSAGLGQLFEGFQSFGNALAAYIVMTIFVLLWTLLLIVPGVVAVLAYSQTFFIMADDKKIDGLAAIRNSKEMMRGNKWKLFCLTCRFAGWFVLCIITLGIALLWVVPYFNASLAKFYDDLPRAPAAV